MGGQRSQQLGDLQDHERGVKSQILQPFPSNGDFSVRVTKFASGIFNNTQQTTMTIVIERYKFIFALAYLKVWMYVYKFLILCTWYTSSNEFKLTRTL